MNEQLIAFLDKYGLVGTYSGGGDSGGIDSFDTEIDVKDDDLEKIDFEALQEWVYGHSLTEFGGWSGNWDADGEIYYDKENKLILVAGTETSDEDQTLIGNIEIRLTEFFTGADRERVPYVFIGITDAEGELTVRMHVENGPWTQSLEDTEQAIRQYMTEQIAPFDNDEGYRYQFFQEIRLTETVNLEIYKIRITDNTWTIDLKETEFSNEILTGI